MYVFKYVHMKKNLFTRLFVSLLVIICSASFAANEVSSTANRIAPSSEIPAKREFPLSAQFKPCDNFHKYVCDEAESAFKLRDDRSRHSFAFNDSSERILEAKKKFFANINSEKKLSSRAQQVKDYYQACMNETAGKQQEALYLKQFVKEVSQLTTPAQFMNYQIESIQQGKASYFGFGANSNQENPKINDIIFISDIRNLPEHSYYENKELMADYRLLVINFFKIIYPSLSMEELAKKADRVIAFEKDFVKIYPIPAVQRQRWSEKRQETQSQFLAKYPHIPFVKISAQAPETAFVFNAIPESLAFLNEKMKPENLEVIKDLFLYSVGEGILDDSNPEYYQKQFAFRNKYLGGAITRSKRDERCTRSVMGTFPKELDQILIAKLFPNFPEQKFQEVAVKIRASIINGLKENTWLMPETKAKAILKMEKAKLFLVKPRNDKEWDFLPVKKFSNRNKLDNAKMSMLRGYQKSITDLKTEVNFEAWGMGPLTVNAYYDASVNKFVMPMGILQYPFFNSDGDIIENLGAVGAVIGHELGHGIDDQGAKYDEVGKLNQWMTMKDLAEFSKRGRKMIDQFNKAGHNGELTLGENIGDLVGLTFAYRAAFPTGEGSVAEKQKLFVAYARAWCNVTRPKAEEQQLKTDPHALGWARINEQVKHQKAFAEAFSCKSGDKMTLPEVERIQIW